MKRIYLDNAATSWPKPESVYTAVDHALREVGAPAGRGSYRHSQEADRLVRQTRSAIARLIGAADATDIAFAANGTDALNLAIHGLVRPNDHVVTTVTEHNSVLRPLRHLQETAGVSVSYVSCDQVGHINPNDVEAALQENTRLVSICHGSNVTGAVQPIEEIGKIVEAHSAFLLVDAAQTLGHLPINVQESGIDLLAAPGHKGLLGPLGTGILYVGPTAQRVIQPMRQGGTGTASEDDRQPQAMPDCLESGNLNVSAIAGLGAGVEFLNEQTLGAIAGHSQLLTQPLVQALGTMAGVTIVGPPVGQPRLPVVSVTVDGYDPQDLAALLDASFGIECRAGFHCAAKIHEPLGTASRGGTVRLSPGFATSGADIATVVAAFQSLSETTPITPQSTSVSS